MSGDDVIGTTDTKSKKAMPNKARKISSQNADELLASEVHAVSSDKGKETKQPGGKKNNKGKERNRRENRHPLENLSNLRKGKQDDPYCMICEEDHWTNKCPHKVEVNKFYKGSKTSKVLTDPFPNSGTAPGC